MVQCGLVVVHGSIIVFSVWWTEVWCCVVLCGVVWCCVVSCGGVLLWSVVWCGAVVDWYWHSVRRMRQSWTQLRLGGVTAWTGEEERSHHICVDQPGRTVSHGQHQARPVGHSTAQHNNIYKYLLNTNHLTTYILYHLSSIRKMEEKNY